MFKQKKEKHLENPFFCLLDEKKKNSDSTGLQNQSKKNQSLKNHFYFPLCWWFAVGMKYILIVGNI